MDWAGYYQVQGHRLEQGQRKKLMVKCGRRARVRAEWAEVEI